MSHDHERDASECCLQDREGSHQHDALVVVGAAAVQESCHDKDAEDEHGGERDGHKYERVVSARRAAKFGSGDCSCSAHEDHGDCKREAQNPKLHVKVSAVRSNESRLGDKEHDPSGEQNTVQVDKRAERRRSKKGLEVVSAREPNEDDKGDDASRRDKEILLTPSG